MANSLKQSTDKQLVKFNIKHEGMKNGFGFIVTVKLDICMSWICIYDTKNPKSITLERVLHSI